MLWPFVTMTNNTKPSKKLVLTKTTVSKLRETLTEEQLKAVVGGATCDPSGGSRSSVC